MGWDEEGIKERQHDFDRMIFYPAPGLKCEMECVNKMWRLKVDVKLM